MENIIELVPKVSNKKSDSFRCSNCSKFSFNLINSCHGIICNQCKVEDEICPTCDSPFLSENLSPTQMKTFKGIVFHCYFKQFGCDLEITADNAEEHIQNCPKSTFTCNQCNVVVSRLTPKHVCQLPKQELDYPI